MLEPQKTFLRYHLRAETLCLGERIRGGVFRPCSPVFRYTTLTGSLTSAFSASSPVHAVARFLPGNSDSNRLETLTFAPHVIASACESGDDVRL